MLQDPKRIVGILAALLLLVVAINVVMNRPASPNKTPQPTPYPRLNPPVQRNGYTIERIIVNNKKSLFHVKVPAGTTRDQMTSFGNDIKAAYSDSDIVSIDFFSGDIDDPKTRLGSWVNGQATLVGEGLNPPGK